jgi:hypothetical protein
MGAFLLFLASLKELFVYDLLLKMLLFNFVHVFEIIVYGIKNVNETFRFLGRKVWN